jgi:outer membrane protein assembly factor BamB
MVGNIRFHFLFLWSALLFSGCSYMPSMPSTVSDMFWDDEDVAGFIEPKPGRSVGLKVKWDRGVAGEPDDYMNHPRQIAVTDDSIFVGTFEGSVVRVDMESGEVLWEAEIGQSVVGGVAVDDERVFAGMVDGKVAAFSRDSGSVLWEVWLSTTVASAPLVADGKVFFTTLNNRTYALSVDSGERIWTHSSVPVALVVKGAATPTTDGRAVYVGYSTGEVFAFNISDGKIMWGKNLSQLSGRSEVDRLQDVDAEVVVGQTNSSNGQFIIYTVNHQGSVMAMRPADGSQLWQRKFSAIRRPLLWKNQIFISNIDGNIVSMSAEDGMEVWRTKISDGYLSAPVKLGSRIVVGDNKGRLFSLDPTSGRVVGLDKLNDPIIANPVVKGNSLFIWTNEGDLIRYEAENH